MATGPVYLEGVIRNDGKKKSNHLCDETERGEHRGKAKRTNRGSGHLVPRRKKETWLTATFKRKSKGANLSQQNEIIGQRKKNTRSG